jgi:hypothetical protein
MLIFYVHHFLLLVFGIEDSLSCSAFMRSLVILALPLVLGLSITAE